MAGHSRSKNGVASLAYARPSTFSLARGTKDVDARHKAWHDELNTPCGEYRLAAQRSSAVRSVNDVISSLAVADPEK
jgi:hypothetical protein